MDDSRRQEDTRPNIRVRWISGTDKLVSSTLWTKAWSPRRDTIDKVDPRIPCRTLLVEHNLKSIVTLPEIRTRTPDHAADCIIKQVSTTGHWVQFEATKEVNQMLESLLEGTLQ